MRRRRRQKRSAMPSRKPSDWLPLLGECIAWLLLLEVRELKGELRVICFGGEVS